MVQERGVKRFLSVTAAVLVYYNFRGMKVAAWGNRWNDARTYFWPLWYVMITGSLGFYPTWGSDMTARALRMKWRKERRKHTNHTTFSCGGTFVKNTLCRIRAQ